MAWMHTKDALRAGLAAPVIRHALRWFINCDAFAPEWRKLAHRKIAKRARFHTGSVFRHVTNDGVTLSLLHGGTSSYLYWLGEYEPETTGLFTTLARTASCIFDVGAADGIYSLLAAAANPEARVFAFEPGEQARRTCERNLALNPGVTARVELRQIALGERDETTTLYVAGETGGTSSLNPEFRRSAREQAVIVRAGDSLLAELGIEHVDLMKIDTESTEPAVLRGLAKQLRTHRPDIICEVLHHRTERELETLLRPLGYRFFWITKSRLVECEALEGDPSYRSPNYLFTCRDDGALRALGVKL
jgi:FkbM family methyltransferase